MPVYCICSEKVRIAQNKPFIVLQGESQKTTIIQWGEAGSSSMSPTFRVDGENFVAANISFVVKQLKIFFYLANVNINSKLL